MLSLSHSLSLTLSLSLSLSLSLPLPPLLPRRLSELDLDNATRPNTSASRGSHGASLILNP